MRILPPTLAFAICAYSTASSAPTSTGELQTSSSPKSRLLSRHEHDIFLEAMDVLREGRKTRKSNERRRLNGRRVSNNGSNFLRALQGSSSATSITSTCEDTLAACEANLAQLQGPSYLYVQVADRCILDITDNGNYVLKSKNFHPQTEVFSDRPFHMEYSTDTRGIFENFDSSFDDGLGPPNAALTFVRDDQSQGVVIKVLVKAVIQHTDDPNGPTYVYKLEQSDEQASTNPLDDIMGGSDRSVFDHCSLFVDSDCDSCNIEDGGGGDTCNCNGGLEFCDVRNVPPPAPIPAFSPVSIPLGLPPF